jgi:hypothetical protein
MSTDSRNQSSRGTENLFIREYDAQNRPTKTVNQFTSRNNGEENFSEPYIETYGAWTVIGATGLRATERAALSVYPNPATDFIRVNLVAPAEVVISDLSGRVVLRQTVAPGEAIPVQALAAGIYLVSVPEDGQTVRIIKY